MFEDHEEIDNFRSEFKFYKRRQPPPNLENVIDFGMPEGIENVHPKVKRVDLSDITCDCQVVGILPPVLWKVYDHKDFPGFLFITNPFVNDSNKFWEKQCLEVYPKKPNVRNIDLHISSKETIEDLWQTSVNERKSIGTLTYTNTPIYKLRWVTLGCHHNWETKLYSADRVSEFPQNLSLLTKYIARSLGFHDYSPEAAIINYYHLDSTLSGHTDHSEPNMDAPLISISFGASAVFLLGGSTKATKPVPLFIKSGDIIVLSGPARHYYHAIPKILHQDLTSDRHILPCTFNTNYTCAKNDTVCQGLCELNQTIAETIQTSDFTDHDIYLSQCRINMNVRQVLKTGETLA